MQQARELGVAVRDVRHVRFGAGGVAEGGDDVPEGEETRVDGDALFDALASGGGAFQLRYFSCYKKEKERRLTRSDPAKSTK